MQIHARQQSHHPAAHLRYAPDALALHTLDGLRALHRA